jgi:SPW repeat
MSKQTRWQDWVTLTLGLWLFFSPFFMAGGSLSDAAAWDAYILGGTVTLFAAFALADSKAWGEWVYQWVNLTLGLWLVAAPFALGFYHTEGAIAWNQIAVGGLIAVDAVWLLARGRTASHA